MMEFVERTMRSLLRIVMLAPFWNREQFFLYLGLLSVEDVHQYIYLEAEINKNMYTASKYVLVCEVILRRE